MTAAALFGFSVSNAYWQLCVWSIPYGLGAGSVDAALNNFVALHYKARHMSWLHCFWGIGATAGPIIMGLYLSRGAPWNSGYQTIGIAQVFLVVCLVLSLPLWRKIQNAREAQQDGGAVGLKDVLRLPGAAYMLAGFFCYCALEATAGLWASSYMVLHKGIDPETAAKWAAGFYLGITAGRFLSGFITGKVGDKNMVRAGQLLAGLGAALLLLPLGHIMTFAGLLLIGIGCAPVYPSLIHATPANFGPDNSQAMIGLQMASAYVGTTLMPFVFGFASDLTGIRAYPLFLLTFILLMVVVVERVNRTHKFTK
jgi:fucose permease